MRVDLRFLDGGGVDEIDFEIVATFVAATLSKSSTGFTVPTLPGTFGQAAWGRSPGDSTSCFTSSRGGKTRKTNKAAGGITDACMYTFSDTSADMYSHVAPPGYTRTHEPMHVHCICVRECLHVKVFTFWMVVK